MDKIDGCEAEEKWEGSRFAACMWIDTEAVLFDAQESTQEYLRPTLLSVMETVTCVCEEAMERFEWVSELTISMQEKENLVALN